MSNNNNNSNSKSGRVKNNQILSMFNNLQCQLMTIQSSMVSLQMNQNVVQSAVDEMMKKMLKLNNKLSIIQSTIGVCTEVTSVTNDTEITDIDQSDRRQKKKKKKKDGRSESETPSETLSIKKKRKVVTPERSFIISNTLGEIDSNSMDKNVVDEEYHSRLVVPVTMETHQELPEEIPTVEHLDVSPIQSEQIRKRKRKRRRKQKAVNEEGEDNEKSTILSSPVPPAAKIIKMNLPFHQQPNNTKITFESDSENEAVPGEGLTGTVSKCTSKRNLPSNKPPPSVNKPLVIQSTSTTGSPGQLVSSPFRPVNERFRQRKSRGLHVGEVLKQIRSEMVLDGESLQTTSIMDDKLSSAVITKTTKETNNLDKEEEDCETDEDVIPVKNYNNFPSLHGPPRSGDIIAYKILELSESYSPQISSYKEADVISYDNETKLIELHLNGPTKCKQEPGKFDLPDEEEENVSDGQQYKNVEYQIQLNWTELIEPKLIT